MSVTERARLGPVLLLTLQHVRPGRRPKKDYLSSHIRVGLPELRYEQHQRSA
jgi:hypothetical protein